MIKSNKREEENEIVKEYAYILAKRLFLLTNEEIPWEVVQDYAEMQMRMLANDVRFLWTVKK